MTEGEALLIFLNGSLGAKRERVADFAIRRATRGKFLNLLYHELRSLFREDRIVTQLPEAAWTSAAFRFSPPNTFGTAVATLRVAYEECAQHELVITADGHFGYWRDETFVDSETLLALPRPVRLDRRG